MRTYEDFQKVAQNPKDIVEFLESAVSEFQRTDTYRDAVAGAQYYNKHNVTIEKYKKLLYTITGNQVEDVFSADYRLKTLFFRRLVLQQVQYVLGNGVTFQEEDTKKLLGKDFDFQLQKAAKRALAEGRAFGFWNLDHLEVFGYAFTNNEPAFCPIYSDETSELMMGIRYWYKMVGNEKVFHCTLYEADGYTNYRRVGENDGEQVGAKQAYVKIESKLPDGTVEESVEDNYSALPIIPLYGNDTHESELIGIRESIDCYDFIKSGFANQIDDLNGVFWVLQNTGGMDDVDLAKFVQRLKTVKAAAIDGDAGVTADAKTVDIPVDARRTMLELLRSDIYEDFQALDVRTLSAAAKTTQEIQAAYQSQDNKCADFEYYIIDFIQRLLDIIGIDDNPTFTWNRVVNQQEQTQTLLMAAEYLSEDVIIKHLPFLTPEEAEEIIEQKQVDDMAEEETDNSDLEAVNSMLDDLLEGLNE